ncbi:inverse autotransporter beta domain-containing protein [Rahnella sp. EDr1-12]|uniref:inverse autotransporter beta domain-containing protein n=1 Tax=unclassified Rahnella TaxID=2635087 RepID=UPI003BA9BB13
MKKLSLFTLAAITFCPLMSSHVIAAESLLLPDLGSAETVKNNASAEDLSAQTNNGFAAKTAQTAVSEAQQNFENLTPEGMKSQAYQYGKSVATSAAQNQIEKTLSPYGHVSTQISLNDDGSLDGSSLDYLIPWYEGESNLIFTQFSAHNTDDRTIANFGAGLRHNLNKDWLVGVNAFYDYDLTRNHRRYGVGAEAWTNYLKFSGNYYIPLSSWKNSPDLEDYEERPSRGWDVRAQAYLPAYPQLGSSVIYEKYYGEQVALFGTDSLQKNPSAVTLGVDYTPIPMITMGLGYKKGNSDNTELTANVALDYRIGVPMAQQLDPSAVADMRSLAGSRMDFVDRNNHIVLEYREKRDLDVGLYLKPTGTPAQCILSDAPDEAQAYEGCHWTVNATITSHLKIKDAQWVPLGGFSAESKLALPALSPQQNISAGQNNHWTLTFPAWVDSADPEANKYALAVMLVDDKGHAKQSNIVNIEVSEAPVNYQLVINDAGEEKKAIKVLSNGNDVVTLHSSGSKVAGLAGETTALAAESLNMTFHAYKMEDKSHAQEVEIHASKSDCETHTQCLFYEQKPEQGEAVIGSTMSGVYSVIAKPENKSSQKTNAVVIDFTPADKMIYTAIVDKENPTVNLTATKGNKLQLGHEYEFKVAYDSNNNGQWDASDRETVTEENKTPIISLMNYRWQFTKNSANGTPGGFATPATDNHDIILPKTNAEASTVFSAAGPDGVQGYELRVDYQLTQTGIQTVKTMNKK